MAMAAEPIYRSSFATSLDQGVSGDADDLRKSMEAVLEIVYGSLSVGGPRKSTLEALYISVARCWHENWDGYGAKSVNHYSYFYARQFLDILPLGLPNPDIGVDPDGEISFEWYCSPRRVFSISVAPNGDLNYSGLFGANTVYGTESFGDELPLALLNNLRRLHTD
jgi:hypothetical protein